MALKTITESEIAQSAVSSLPSRPNVAPQFGGRGYTPQELKAAFDKLPRLIIQRLNVLIEMITSGGLAEELYLDAQGQTLQHYITSIHEVLDTVQQTLDTKQDTLAWDKDPTEGSQNPVTSQGVYSAMQNLEAAFTNQILPLLGIHLALDKETYCLALRDGRGQPFGDSVDLPLESVVVGGNYDSETREIVLTLENGNRLQIPLGDLIEGLVTPGEVENAVSHSLEGYVDKESHERDWEEHRLYLNEQLQTEKNATQNALSEKADKTALHRVEEQTHLALVLLERGGVVSRVEVEDTYIQRAAGGGEVSIADGVKTRVMSVEGATVKSPNTVVDLSVMNYEKKGVVFTSFGNRVTAKGVPTALPIQQAFPVSLFQDGETYTFWQDVNCMGPTSKNAMYWMVVATPKGEGTAVSHQTFGVKPFSVTFDKTNYNYWVCITTGSSYPYTEDNPMDTAVRFMCVRGAVAPTEFIPYFLGVKSLSFRGIHSYGKNRIPYPYAATPDFQNGVTYQDVGDGTLRMVGTSVGPVSIPLFQGTEDMEYLYLPPGTYTFGDAMPQGVSLLGIGHEEESYLGADALKNALLEKPVFLKSLSIEVEGGIEEMDIAVRPMIHYGADTPLWEVGRRDTSFQLASPVDLGAWDTVDVEAGTLVRATKEDTFGQQDWGYAGRGENGEVLPPIFPCSIGEVYDIIAEDYDTHLVFGGFDAVGYERGVYLVNPGPEAILCVVDPAYQTPEAWLAHVEDREHTTAPLSFAAKIPPETTHLELPKGYVAWRGGSEVLIEGDVNNSLYGATPTVTQIYYAVEGETV